VKKVIAAKLVIDHVGADPLIVVVGSDNETVRAFRNLSPARDFYRLEGNNALFTDAQTGSQWNFQGCAVSGAEKGRCLEGVRMIKDYWFDWKNYHPNTTIF
jgi:hypothetical protein